MSFDKNNLLAKIKNGEIKLKPKWLFVVKFLSLIIGAIISVLSIILLISLMMFIVFYNDNSVFKNTDLLNFQMIFKVLPWTIMALTIVLIGLFELFIKKILPIYRKPLITVSIIILLMFVTISIGVNQTKAFQSLCTCQRNVIKPLAWLLNKNENKQEKIIQKGIIKDMIGSKMVIEMADGKIINMNKNNFCKKCLTDLLVGQTVIISGVEKNGEFKPFKGKSDSSQCGGCQQQNEIKSNNTCNNIQKGRKNNKKDK